MCDYVRECIFIHSTAAVAIILYEILLLHTTFNTIGGIVLLLLLLRRRDCYFLVNEVIAHATTISKQSLTAQSLFFLSLLLVSLISLRTTEIAAAVKAMAKNNTQIATGLYTIRFTTLHVRFYSRTQCLLIDNTSRLECDAHLLRLLSPPSIRYFTVC